MQFGDLSNDSLMEVLERISPASLLKMARVNKRLNKLVEIKLPLKIKKVVVERETKETQNCRHQRFDNNDVVYFMSEPAYFLFFMTLARFPNVKSIDFGRQEVTGEVLQEVAKLCLEIECITVRRTVKLDNIWHDFFSQLGHQIVHFNWMVYKSHSLLTLTTQILEMITSLCPNIKQVGISSKLNASLVNLIGQLPKDCFVGVDVDMFFMSFGDTIDQLSTSFVFWFAFGNRNQRLKKLTFKNTDYETQGYLYKGFGVEFVSLKQLTVDRGFLLSDLDCLAMSRFPALEVLNLHLTKDSMVTEDWYNCLFIVMPELKQLRIDCSSFAVNDDDDLSSVVPGPAVLQLKKFERIQLKINEYGGSGKAEGLIQKLNWYLDEIPTLKGITVKVGQTYLDDYNRFVKSGDSLNEKVNWIDELMKLKVKDNRFDIGALN